MRQLLRRMVPVTMAIVLLLCFNVTAFAAGSTVTWQGQEKGFGIGPGSEYTSTDLFGSFKGVMPGDKRTQTVTLKNTATDSDAVGFYLRAVPHGNGNAPLTATEEATVAAMQDFLSQLTMRVYNGGTLIYDSTADQTASLTDRVYLGQLASNESLVLTVELEVPITLDNRYAGRIGEVDWVFTAEQVWNPETLTVKKVWSDNGENRPTSVTVALYDGTTQTETMILSEANNWTYTWKDLDGVGDWSVEEINIPEGYKATYKVADGVTTITNTSLSSLIQTGQLNWPIPVLIGIGSLLVVVGLFFLIIKRKRDRD